MNLKHILWAIIIISGLIMSLYLLSTNTNVIFKQEGTNFTKSFIIPSSNYEGDGGYVRLVRDSRTPSVLDWAKFSNNEQYLYFTLNPTESIKENIYISLPSEMNKGVYYIGLEFNYVLGVKQTKTIKFRVV